MVKRTKIFHEQFINFNYLYTLLQRFLGLPDSSVVGNSDYLVWWWGFKSLLAQL